jgi:formylglycine-generating enzyme
MTKNISSFYRLATHRYRSLLHRLYLYILRKNQRAFSNSVKVVFFSFSLSCFLLPINGASTSFAKTIWCNPNNTSSSNGNSKASGYKTLHQALAVMSSGDEVVIVNGDWRKTSDMFIDSEHKPPDGTLAKFSIVRAEKDWGVKLPYIHIETPKDNPQGYLEFRGIVFDNKFIGLGRNHVCYHMHHTKFVRCGFLAHGLKRNSHTCGFGSTDEERTINRYNLMEECIAWGSGRYIFYCKYGKYNIFRRCVARRDYNRAPQMFNYRAYACDYTVYQNCISIDSDRIANYAKPLNAESGGFWISDQNGGTGNIVDGCMSIKDIQIGYCLAGSDRRLGSATARNCIALDMTYKLPKLNTYCAFVLLQNENAKVSNFTGIGAKLKGQDGIYCKKSGKKYIENCIVSNVNDQGVGINPSSDSVTITNVVYFNVGGGKYGKNSIRLNPFKNGLLYPVRIEVDSKLAKLGKKGTVCGATVLNKIGISGSLHGDPGWNQVTNEALWPFPNEKKIKELMRETVEGVSGIYGFCEDGQTLTNYIWGYLGNTVPPFNLKAIPGNGMVTLKWDPPAKITIDSITGFNAYKLDGKNKTLVGGTIAGNTNFSKSISGLQNGSTYEFAVTAIDKVKGESALSFTVFATPENSERLSTRNSPPALTIQKEKNAEKVIAEGKISNKYGMEFELIQPGTFAMGILSAEEDTTSHQVTLTKGFYIQKTEVTQGHWKTIMGKNPSFFKECGNECPVEQVSWNDVQHFIEKLNQLEGTIKYRLPTEAEWEYSCRAGTRKPFASGNCLSTEQANYNGNYPFVDCPNGLYRKRPISIKSLPHNAWNLSGMHGNVWEWCQDWLGNYSSKSVVDPVRLESGSLRVIRGGGWNSYAKACRSGNRSGIDPTKRFANLGFRIVRDR